MALDRLFNPLTFVLCAMLAAATFLLASCDEKDDTKPPKEVKLDIGGKTFKLEPVFESQTRFKGLSDRTSIADDGGMLFVFPDKAVQVQHFVMRDCPIPIDIIYLDKSGRITAMHEMKIEPPRTEAEKKKSPPKDKNGKEHPEMPEWTWSNEAYENRLPGYSSEHDSQFVIELKGGTLKTLKLKKGDKITLDIAGLKKHAKE